MTPVLGRSYIVRIHGRPPAVARIDHELDGRYVVRLRQGYRTWARKARMVGAEHIVREATLREVAVGIVIHPLPWEAA